MKSLCVVALLFTLAVSALGQMTVSQNPTAAYTFDRCMNIGGDGKTGKTTDKPFMLYWRIMQDPVTKMGVVRFATETPSTGWSAIGLSPDGSMNGGGKGSDINVSWKDSQSATINVDDRWAAARALPPVDDSQDLMPLGASLTIGMGEENPPMLVSAWERYLATDDAADRDVTPETPQWVIFAVNDVAPPPSADQLAFHSRAGARLINWNTDGANCQTAPNLPDPNCPAADWSNSVTVNVRLNALGTIPATDLAVYAEVAGVCANRIMCDTCNTPGSVHKIKIASASSGKPSHKAGSALTWALNGAAQSSFTLATAPAGAASTTTNVLSNRTGNKNLVQWPHVDGATHYWASTFDASGQTLGSMVVSDLETACPDSVCKVSYDIPPPGQSPGTLYTVVYTFNKVKDVVSEASSPAIVTRAM